MVKKISSLTLLVLCILPVFASAQLTSENYTVTGSTVAPGSVSLDGTSVSYDTDLEAGGLYILDADTPTPPPASGGGGGGTRTRNISPNGKAAPVASASLLVGPARASQGALVVLAILVNDSNGKPTSPPGLSVSVSVRGANSTNITATPVAPGIFTAQYHADNVGQDVVNAFINDVAITRDTDGKSDGSLAVTIFEPVPTPAPVTAVEPPELPEVPEREVQSEPVISSGVTATCNRAFTWEVPGRVTISRQIGETEPVTLVTLTGRMSWYVDTEAIELEAVQYAFTFANQSTAHVSFAAADFTECVPDTGAMILTDIDDDQNTEQFVDGIYQDLDGSTVPLARTAYGLVLDTDGDLHADTFWNPSVGTSKIILAEDRLFVIDPAVSPTQSYEPRVQGTYYIVLEPGSGRMTRPEPITGHLNPLIDALPAPEKPRSTMPFEDFLIITGFMAGLLSVLYGLSRIPFSITNLSYFFMQGGAHFFALCAFWRRRREWGTVYDSVTKAPIDPAIIELYDEAGVQQASAITDLDGRYGFLVPSGIYTMLVRKTHYLFPSTRIQSRHEDTVYSNLYLGGPLEVNATVVYDVPMDPTVFDWNQYEKMRTKQTRFIHRLDPFFAQCVQVIFYLGLGAVAWQWYSVQNWPTALVFVTYLLLLLLRHTRGKPVLYGTLVKDKKPLSFALVHVMKNDMQIMHKVADVYGRYVAILAPGTYTVRIEERVDADTFRTVFEGEVKAKKGIINQNFKL